MQIPLINAYKNDEKSPFDTCLEKAYLLIYHGKGLASKTMKILIKTNRSLKFHLT